MQIVVATHNEGKLVEIRRILEEDLGADAENIELVSAGSLHLPDPVETGVTFQENALLKARAVAIRTGLPSVADDSGLIVDVMGNAPGILSARWAGAHGHDKANNALLLAQIEDIPDDKRTARFRCAAALVVPDTETGADVTGGVAGDGHRLPTASPFAPRLPMGALPRCMLDTPSSRRQWSSATCRVASSARLVANTVSVTIRCLSRTISLPVASVLSLTMKASR